MKTLKTRFKRTIFEDSEDKLIKIKVLKILKTMFKRTSSKDFEDEVLKTRFFYPYTCFNNTHFEVVEYYKIISKGFA